MILAILIGVYANLLITLLLIGLTVLLLSGKDKHISGVSSMDRPLEANEPHDEGE